MTELDRLLSGLILTSQANYAVASRWTLFRVWIFGCHRMVHHLGRMARLGFWRGQPYLLTFRKT